MSKKDKNIFIYSGKVILITLLFVLFVREFLIAPYTVSSVQMETALLNGDRVLIDKTAYGIRMPITLLTIPFTFDKIGRFKSYSTVIELPYKRLFAKTVKRNDIVLFNNPSETDKPLDKRSLLLSRCVALPGDTIGMKNGMFYINNQPFTTAPDYIEEYSLELRPNTDFKKAIDKLDIPLRNFHQKADSVFLQLSRFEAYLLQGSLTDTLRVVGVSDKTRHYEFVIPFKGKIINADELNLTIYKQVILTEQGQNAKIENNKLYIGGQLQTDYTFGDDYYWLLSDNTISSLDSRSFGFIPFRNIIGKLATK